MDEPAVYNVKPPDFIKYLQLKGIIILQVTEKQLNPKIIATKRTYREL
jgi:hypothetical protein